MYVCNKRIFQKTLLRNNIDLHIYFFISRFEIYVELKLN